MNAGVIRKAWRETWPLLSILCPAIIVFEIALMFALQNFASEVLNFVLKTPFIRALLESLLGGRLGIELSPTTLAAFGLVHPAFLALSWAGIVTFSSRIAGEIERGTADVLLTLPVSRTGVFASSSLVCVAATIPMSLCAWAGIFIGTTLAPPSEPIDVGALRFAVANLAMLEATISATTLALSTFPSRRGHAIGIVTGGLAVSLLLNFVAGLVPFFQHMEALGILYYYRPLETIRAHEYPWGRISALLAISSVALLVGWHRFRTRDIPSA